jgi:hypothetical protein
VIKLLLCLLIVIASFGAHAADSYVGASERSRRDATDPEQRDWYLGSMRPAFRAAFAPALNTCASSVPRSALSAFGLVLVVDGSGGVSQLHWKSSNALSECLEPKVRGFRFPFPPKGEFYFGLEAELGG